VIPTAPGDFRAPWATASGCGTISRAGQAISLGCTLGNLSFQRLQLGLANPKPAARLAGRTLQSTASRMGSVTTIQFSRPVSIEAGQTLIVT